MSARTELDKMQFSYVRFNPLTYEQIEPSEIYLARPGHRIIGKLNGIEESTCSLSINLNNTAEISFTVNRIIDGQISAFYEQIDRHYELYVTHFGWFKINEEPQLDNDGNYETKSVRAESGEIELQQFDLIEFYVNNGDVNSLEMMATDNTYEIGEYKLPRDNVKFWRDTSELETLIENFPSDGTTSDLLALVSTYPNAISHMWRIQFDLDDFDDAITSAVAAYRAAGIPMGNLANQVGNIKTQLAAWKLAINYPYIFDYINIDSIDLTNYDYDESDPDSPEEYSVYEILQLELQRQKDLSFLDCVLENTGWTVGFVDPTYNATSEDEEERQPLADKVGKFEVQSQDVYSFLMQNASQYYRCIFDFDTENYKVNAYKVESLGVDTNIFISFHNIQNSVTRSSDRELHTVYSVSNGSSDDSIDIKEGNFDNSDIEDLSYFLTTDHFDQETIQKYNAWKTFRDEKIQDFMDLCIQQRDEYDKLLEIYNRVPVDGVNSAQYSTMTVEELEAEIANMKAMLRGYEAMHLDANGDTDWDDLRSSLDWAQYQLITDYILSTPQNSLMIVTPTSTWNTYVDDLEGLKRDLETANDELDELNRELPILQNILDDLEDKLDILQDELDALEDDLDEYEEIEEPTDEEIQEMMELNNAIIAKRAEITNMQNNISDKQDEISDKEDEISDKEDGIDDIESDISSAETSVRNYYLSHVYDGIIDDNTIENVGMYYIDNDDYHLGLIDTELYNRWHIGHYETGEGESGLKKVEFDEDYIYDLTKYGNAYGVSELQILKKDLYNKVYVAGQYADVDLATADEYHVQGKQNYLKYVDAYETCIEVLETRQQEYDAQQAVYNNIRSQRKALVESVDINNASFGFTAKELWLLQKYRLHTDYTNENIVVTDISTNSDYVNQARALVEDAMEELYADSHPQWNFATTQDNLLLMPELQDWHGQLEIGNFIRVGFREDDPQSVISSSKDNQVKLRLIGITLNPFMIDTSIDLEFSNMVQYKSKRNDFVSILGLNSGSGKNQITATYASHAGTADTVNITTDFIMKLVNSAAFGAAAGNAIVSGGYILDALNNMNISVDQIGDLTRRLTDLVNGYVDANVITTKLLHADTATINELSAKLINTQTLNANQAVIDYLTAGFARIDFANIDTAEINTAKINDLYATTGVVRRLVGEQGQFTNFLEAVYLDASNITVGTLSVDRLVFRGQTKSVVYELNNITGALQSVDVDTLNGEILTPRSLNADRLVARTITATEIAANSITAFNIKAHTVTASLLRSDAIMSTNYLSGREPTSQLTTLYNTRDSLYSQQSTAQSQYDSARDTLDNLRIDLATLTTTLNTLEAIEEPTAEQLEQIETTKSNITSKRSQIKTAENTVNVKAAALDSVEDDIKTNDEAIQTIRTQYAVPSNHYSSLGTFLDLSTGSIYTPKLHVDGTSGDAYFAGHVYATSLTLGNDVTVSAGNLTGLSDLTTVGYTDSSNTGFMISYDGLLEAKNALIYGTIYSSIGRIGGWTLSDGSIYSVNDVSKTYINSAPRLVDALKTSYAGLKEVSDNYIQVTTFGNHDNCSFTMDEDLVSRLFTESVTYRIQIETDFLDTDSSTRHMYFSYDDMNNVSHNLEYSTSSNITYVEFNPINLIAINGDVKTMTFYFEKTNSGYFDEGEQFNVRITINKDGSLFTVLSNVCNIPYVVFDHKTISGGTETQQFYLTSEGELFANNAIITGTINANVGKIGGDNGWTIAAQQLYSGTIGNDSSMQLATTNLTGTVAGQNLSTWRFTVGSNFGVTNTGKMYCSDIIASGGSIGNLLITGYLTTNANRTTYNNTTYTGFTLDQNGIGGYGSANAYWTLTSNGVLTATGVNISGQINASSGSIGGLLINNYLTTNANRTTYNNTTYTGFTLDQNGIGGYGSANAYWTLTSDGVFTAQGATITGTINATSGKIGGTNGWNITTNKIYSGTVDSGTTSGDITLSTTDFTRSIGSVSRSGLRFAIGSNFGVKNNGDIYSGWISVQGSSSSNTYTRISGGEMYLHSRDDKYFQIWLDRFASNICTYFRGDVPIYVEPEMYFLNYKIEMTRGDTTYRLRPVAGVENAILGSSNYQWRSVYCSDGSWNGSDRKIKNHIEYLIDDENIDSFFDNLKPVMYTLKNGEGMRHHMGLYAQDVSEAAYNSIGDIAAYQACVDNKEMGIDEGYFDENVDDEHLVWSLNYSELVAPIIAIIQKDRRRISQLEQEIENLKQQLN